jgi:uncharacterized iron-regulated membrane protein
VSGHNQATAWTRWVRQPQRIWLRRAIFQVHLWSGIGIGLYILMISLTGSVLVYRNGPRWQAIARRSHRVSTAERVVLDVDRV